MAKEGTGSVVGMRLYQKLQRIPLCLLPLVLSAAFLTFIVFVTSFKVLVSCMLSDPNFRSPAPSVTVAVPTVPAEVSLALLHFATTPEIPQQSRDEISVSMRALADRGPCNFLVVGLWFDSLLWATFNYGGRTAFLDESQDWIDRTNRSHPQLETYKVNYSTRMGDASDLLQASRRLRSGHCRPHQKIGTSSCPLALGTGQGLPVELLEVEWDAIMIDGPRSFKDPSFPGRMSPIFTAAVMARARSGPGHVDIFVHDVSRPVEKLFAEEFLCKENLVASVGDLWHFRVQASEAADFCSSGPV